VLWSRSVSRLPQGSARPATSLARIIGARLVRDVMRLAFLLERTYTPYSKWLGTAFTRLACGPALGPHLEATLAASDWRTREHHLAQAWELVARLQNALGVTDPVPEPTASPHGRPYLVITRRSSRMPTMSPHSRHASSTQACRAARGSATASRSCIGERVCGTALEYEGAALSPGIFTRRRAVADFLMPDHGVNPPLRVVGS